MNSLGNFDQARQLLEAVLEVRERTLPPGHPDLESSRTTMGTILLASGDLHGSLRYFEKAREGYELSLPPFHPNLQDICCLLAKNLILLNRGEEAEKQAHDALRGTVEFLSQRIRTGAVRGIDESVRWTRPNLDLCLSLGRDGSWPAKECFLAAETFRSAGSRAGLVRRIIAREGSEVTDALCHKLTRANLKVAEAPSGKLGDAVMARDRAERALAQRVAQLPGALEAMESPGMAEIAGALPKEWKAVFFLRFKASEFGGDEKITERKTSCYLAFVLDRKGEIEQVELGPAEPIDDAATTWRESLCKPGRGGAESKAILEAGVKLRELVWDRVRKELAETTKVVVAPDSVLATIPFDALPQGKGILAEKYTFAYVNSLSILALNDTIASKEKGDLIAFGGVDYDATPEIYCSESSPEAGAGGKVPALLAFAGQRSAPRFPQDGALKPLPGTREEAAGVAQLFRGAFGKKGLLIENAQASKASLIALAPRARYLHVATHGFFAAESVKSILDAEPSRGYGNSMTLEEEITGLAPSLLCGLCLAGSNLPREGREDKGVITAEEIQGLDLDGCQLAVLSACESNVGLVREGQGIMSLQRALAIAGARGSVTTLWKVDDQATKLFFKEFYRRLWEDGMSPPAALRSVKLSMLHRRILPENEGTRRGPREPRNLKELPLDYSHPFFWASFVYWGRVD